MSGARESAISGEDLDADNAGGDESTKSERKRQRERQRRSDLASAFDELAAILSLIDPDESDSMSTRQKRKKKSVGDSADPDAGDNAGSTRLDLIGKSVEVLRRLHSENIELKRIHENSGEGKDDKEVFVMVPTLTSVDNEHGELHSSPPHMIARAPGSYSHQPYYPHHSPSHAAPPMGYHQGPPPDYRGYYSSPPSHMPPQMQRNYGSSYQHGGNWSGGGGHHPFYQLPPPVSQYPPHEPSPPQHYESPHPSRTIHSQGSTG